MATGLMRRADNAIPLRYVERMLQAILFVLSTLAIGVAHADERYITLASTTSTELAGYSATSCSVEKSFD